MKILGIFFYIAALAFLSGKTLNAQTTIASGDWDTPAIWNPTVPAKFGAANITISEGDTITATSNFSNSSNTSSLTIEHGGVLEITGTIDLDFGFTLIVHGDLIVNGDFIVKNNFTLSVTGTVTINGKLKGENSSVVNIDGSGDFYVRDDFDIKNSGTVDLDGTLSVGGDFNGGNSVLIGTGVLNLGGVFDINHPAPGWVGTSVSTIFWEGTTSTAWEVNTNWKGNILPSNTKAVIIPSYPSGGRFPIVNTSAAVCKSLELHIGATLDVASAGVLTLTDDLGIEEDAVVTVNAGGDIVIPGNFRIVSSEVGTGAFIDLTASGVTISGTAIVETYAVGGNYHAISSPFSNTAKTTFTVVGSFTNPNFYEYQETNANIPLNWMYGWQSPSESNLIPGKGYFSYNPSTTTYELTGSEFNHGDITRTITHTHNLSDDTQEGWNLIGNPYPCPINAVDFITANSDIQGALYCWDEPSDNSYNTADYASITAAGTVVGGGGANIFANGNVAVGQAFFVQSALSVGVSGSIKFTDAMKNPENAYFFKSAKKEAVFSRVKLSVVDPQNSYNETLVAFSDVTTSSYDNGYDAVKKEGNPDFALFSILDITGIHCAIQAERELYDDEERTVQIGIHAGYAGDYTFNPELIEGISGALNVTLVDIYENRSYDLRESGSFTIYLESGLYTDRFFLQISPKGVTNIADTNETNVVVSSENQVLKIRNLNSEPEAQVMVYDIQGRVIAQENMSSSELNIPVNGHNNIVFVTVLSNSNTFTQKVFVN